MILMTVRVRYEPYALAWAVRVYRSEGSELLLYEQFLTLKPTKMLVQCVMCIGMAQVRNFKEGQDGSIKA